MQLIYHIHPKLFYLTKKGQFTYIILLISVCTCPIMAFAATFNSIITCKVAAEFDLCPETCRKRCIQEQQFRKQHRYDCQTVMQLEVPPNSPNCQPTSKDNILYHYDWLGGKLKLLNPVH